MAEALGVKFLNEDEKEIQIQGGTSLLQVSKIDTSQLDPRLRHVQIDVACNWFNQLCGEQGVARVFGPLADLYLDEKTREVKRGNNLVDLTPREFDLLHFLMKHENQVLNREQIVTNVWGFDYYGDTNVVDVYIRYLRKKVDCNIDVPLIHTVRGVGYVLKV